MHQTTKSKHGGGKGRWLAATLGFLMLAGWGRAQTGWTGLWRLDTAQSSPLDGWNDMDLRITEHGSQVAITHLMQWRTTKYQATNTYDTAKTVEVKPFFMVFPRHMAVYETKAGATQAAASWLDGGKTLRIATDTQVEVSQGVVPMRIYSEYRLGELGRTLTLLELRSSRDRPLVYVFHRVDATEDKK